VGGKLFTRNVHIDAGDIRV